MTSICRLISLGCLGTISFLSATSAYSQVDSSIQATSSSSSVSATQPISATDAALQTYVAQQASLMQQRNALVSQGATLEQMQAWYQQNASLFELQQQRADAMAAVSALQPSPANGQANIPANASQTLKDFLNAQTTLSNVRAIIHNRLVQSLTSTATADQVSTVRQTEMLTFQQQYGAILQLQLQRSEALTLESAKTVLPNVPVLQIGSDATPQEAAYQTQLYQLALNQTGFWNQYVNADSTLRATALQAWWQQKAGSLLQLQQAQEAAQASISSQD